VHTALGVHNVPIQTRKNKNGTTSYVARVRDARGKQHNRVFPKRADAVKWHAANITELATGVTAPAPARVTVDQFIEQ
jgi:hypothetical protein